MSGVVLAFAEQRSSAFRKPAFEITSAAARLSEEIGGETVALIIGAGVKEMAGELGKYGASRVITVDNDALKDYSGEKYAAAVLQAAEQVNPTAVLFAASAMGKDLAPRVAARLGTGVVSDCLELKSDDGKITARRPLFAGKVQAWIESSADCFVATLRPNVFTADEKGGEASVESIDYAEPDGPQSILKEILQEASGKIELTEADIIVSGGRGMKDPENYKMLEELAGLLKGAVGASRAAVDSGWRPHSDQVGQTGKTVSPTLYIACGISGAIQHLAGMSSSKFIVAVNKDADAPIFKAADYGIVGDLFEVVPAMIEEAKKL